MALRPSPRRGHRRVSVAVRHVAGRLDVRGATRLLAKGAVLGDRERVAELFVTGIGGFLGLTFAELARGQGHVVRGLDASPAAVERATRAGFSAVRADVTDEAAVARAMGRVDGVVHTAAVVEEDGERAFFHRVNVGGTDVVVRAAREAGARRFVQISSVMVYGFSYPALVAEDGPLATSETNPYVATKIESERVVLGAHAPGRFDVVVLRPADIYGPGSVPWVLRPLSLMRARLFAVPREDGVINPVHVDDVARATLLALEARVTGTAYNVTGGYAVGCGSFFGIHARWLGRRSVPAVPAALLRGGVHVIAAASRLVRRPPAALPAGVDYLLRPAAYSGRKAAEALGFRARVPLEEGMARTARALGLTPFG